MDLFGRSSLLLSKKLRPLSELLELKDSSLSWLVMIGCSSGVCKFLTLKEFKSSSDFDYFAAATSPGLRGGSLGAELSFRYFSLGLLEANSFWSPTTTTRSCSSSSLLKFKFFLRLSKSSGWLSIKSSFVRKSSVGFCSLIYRFNSCNIR